MIVTNQYTYPSHQSPAGGRVCVSINPPPSINPTSILVSSNQFPSTSCPPARFLKPFNHSTNPNTTNNSGTPATAASAYAAISIQPPQQQNAIMNRFCISMTPPVSGNLRSTQNYYTK